MKRRQRRQGLVAEINITPFTDVILVLLIIFMITTPLISELSIKVKLPPAKSGKTIEDTKQFQSQITITAEGPMYLDGKLVTRKELKGKINQLHNNYPELGVLLRVDRAVRFKEVVNVLDVLTELGITKLDIAASNEQ